MRAIGLSAAALLLANVLMGAPAPARAEEDGWDAAMEPADYEDDAPDPDDFDEALAPYGAWVDEPSYGSVWRPAVSIGWRPYVDGHWVWTAYGWTWIAPGPWGWTFHYGRWAYVPIQGWVWVPGTVWGPAWVDWYYGDGYVGWAPLAPFATHVTVINQFVFVRSPDFCARRLHVVGHRHVPGHVVRGWGRGRRHFRPPVPHEIERVSRHRVVRVSGRPRDTVAPRRGGGGRVHGEGRGGHGGARGARLRDHDGPRPNRPVSPRREREPDHTGAVSVGRAERGRRAVGGRERIVDPAPPADHGARGGVQVRRGRVGGAGPRLEHRHGGPATSPWRGQESGRTIRRDPGPSTFRAEQGRVRGGASMGIPAGERGSREGAGGHGGAARGGREGSGGHGGAARGGGHGQLGLR
jgi:hypothetical protein